MLDRLSHDDATCVEVGVWRGELAAHLLAARPRLHLVLVDPWLAGSQNGDWQASGALLAQCPQSEIEAIYQGVVSGVGRDDRVRLLRMPSIEAAGAIADQSCDAVFIDANHAAEAVAADINAWLPKVRPGGWIGGHDYGYPRFPGVRAVVDALFPHAVHGADWTWFAPIGCPA